MLGDSFIPGKPEKTNMQGVCGPAPPINPVKTCNFSRSVASTWYCKFDRAMSLEECDNKVLKMRAAGEGKSIDKVAKSGGCLTL